MGATEASFSLLGVDASALGLANPSSEDGGGGTAATAAANSHGGGGGEGGDGGVPVTARSHLASNHISNWNEAWEAEIGDLKAGEQVAMLITPLLQSAGSSGSMGGDAETDWDGGSGSVNSESDVEEEQKATAVWIVAHLQTMSFSLMGSSHVLHWRRMPMDSFTVRGREVYDCKEF